MMLSLLDKIVKALGWMTGFFRKALPFCFATVVFEDARMPSKFIRSH